MNKLKRSQTVAGLPRLLAAALIVAGCRDSVSPTQRGPGGPEGWLVEPPPPAPPPAPPPIVPHLVVTLVNTSAVARVAGCMVNPVSDEAASTIAADVTVEDDPGGTIGAVTVSLGPENPGGTLCGSTTLPVSGGVAHFSLGVDLGVPPPACVAGGCTYTLTATAAGATSGVSGEFTISLIS
jgi:hypothetical protein